MENFLKKYDINEGQVKILEGFDSKNYLISSTQKFVLKHYLNPLDLEMVNAECEIIQNLDQDLKLELPTLLNPIEELEDKTFFREIKFVSGKFLNNVVLTQNLVKDLGRVNGELILSLKGTYSSPIQARKSEWDTQYLDLNEDKLRFIKNALHRKHVLYFLDQWKHHVKPFQKNLRHSIIHGDLNENNILTDGQKITGLIDFGDICYSPIINDIAIALAYVIMLKPEDAIQTCLNYIEAFSQKFPLTQEEVRLLYYLIPSRWVCTVLNAAAKTEAGDDRDYISQNEKGAHDMLCKWLTINPKYFENECRKVLGLSSIKESTPTQIQKRKDNFSDSLSLSYTTPIHMGKAAFQYMYDVHGNTFLDAYNNIPHVGHSHPKISEVVTSSIRKLNTNTRYVFNELQAYSEKLLSYFPQNLDKLFLVNSGSAASDLAIRIAMTHTNRKVIAVLEHGYHGNTRLAIDASSYKFDGKGGKGKPKNVVKLPLPKSFDGEFSSGKLFAEQAISILKSEIKSGNKPSCFIAEPISGCGGQVPLANGYLKTLVPFLNSEGILYISDEVQTGFGRLGSDFWGFEFQNVIPDLVVLGKPMGNGHPLAGVVSNTQLADSFANGMEFFSSFGGNPISCAIGKTVLEIIEDEELQKNALETGRYWKEKLQILSSQFDFITDVRGQGLFLGVEIYEELDHGYSIAKKLKNQMRDRHILISTDGPHNSVLKMKPPLCFTKENVDTMVQNLRAVLTSF